MAASPNMCNLDDSSIPLACNFLTGLKEILSPNQAKTGFNGLYYA
jgi:hypothetical protein